MSAPGLAPGLLFALLAPGWHPLARGSSGEWSKSQYI